MKQKQVKALLPVAATLTHAIISSRKSSDSGVTAAQAVQLLDDVMQKLSECSHDGGEWKSPSADRQPEGSDMVPAKTEGSAKLTRTPTKTKPAKTKVAHAGKAGA